MILLQLSLGLAIGIAGTIAIFRTFKILIKSVNYLFDGLDDWVKGLFR